MRRALPVLCLLALLLPPTAARAGDAPPGREAIERDLVLEATLTSPKTIQPGEPVRVRARIVNRSKTATHRLVRPGDGSTFGWREPHVFFTAETLDPRGVRTPVPEAGIGRCGLFDADWQDDVVSLAPGEALELDNWMPAAHHRLRFDAQGPVEMRLHYRYTAGRLSKGGKRPADEDPQATGAMGDTPAFELVSAPIRFHVLRLMDVRLVAKATAVVGRSTRLSTLADLEIRNLASDPQLVSGAEVQIQVVRPGGTPPFFSEHVRIPPSVEAKLPALGGGDLRTWSGATAWQTLPDWRLTATRPGGFMVVATWRPTGGKAVYRSEPTRIEVRAP